MGSNSPIIRGHLDKKQTNRGHWVFQGLSDVVCLWAAAEAPHTEIAKEGNSYLKCP